MNDSTAEDMETLLKEENIQTLIHILKPLITAAVNAAIPPELMTLTAELTLARQDLQIARTELKAAEEKFVTVEEAKKIGRDIGGEIRQPLTQSLDDGIAAMNEEVQKQNQSYNAQIGEVRALALTTQQEVGALKAGYDEQLKELSRRVEKNEKDISSGVAAVVKNSKTLSRAVGRWISENREQKEKTDKQIAALETAKTAAQTDIHELQNKTGNLNASVEGFRVDLITTVNPLRDKVNALQPEVNALKTWKDTADDTLRYVKMTGTGIRWLVKNRPWGNVTLALILSFVVGFQVLFAVLSFKLVQQYSVLISILQR